MTMLSIVIPAFNEEAGIQAIMRRVLAIRSDLETVGVGQLEVIVVDDGSTDQTAERIRTQPEVRLVQHTHNSGYGAALKTGFAEAKGEWIGFLDADGTYPPESFSDLYQAAIAQDAEIVIGSRMVGGESRMPLVRRIGNLIFARLVSLISAKRITDSASGMRIFRRTILPRLYPLPDGLNLTPVMSTRALHERLHMIEVPISYEERVGRSKLSVVRDGMRFAQSIVWTALYYNPVRPLGLLSICALGIAGLIGVGLVVARVRGAQSIDPLGAFTLFSALVLAVAGVSILALGMSFNYFVALFHKTPVRQGLFIRPLMQFKVDKHFGSIGLVTLCLGLVIAGISLVLAFSGWTLLQLWLYYLTSACLSLIGIQLIIAWVQMQILDTLRLRDALVAEDLQGSSTSAQEPLPGTMLTVKQV